MSASRTPVSWRSDGPPRHLLPEPDALALADVPLLLQVLRVRHAQGAPARAGRGRADPRRRAQAPREGAAGAHGRGARPPSGRPEAAERARLRGLHRLRGVGVRAGARARAAAAHQPRRAQPRGARPAARGHRLPGADARVGQPGSRRPPGLADQAPGAAAGDDPRRRRAADPVHERDPRRHRRVRGGPDGVAGGARRLRPHPGGHPPELRPAPPLLRRGAGRHRDRRGRGLLAHGDRIRRRAGARPARRGRTRSRSPT